MSVCLCWCSIAGEHSLYCSICVTTQVSTVGLSMLVDGWSSTEWMVSRITWSECPTPLMVWWCHYTVCNINLVISFWSASIEIVMRAVILTLETNHKDFCDFKNPRWSQGYGISCAVTLLSDQEIWHIKCHGIRYWLLTQKTAQLVNLIVCPEHFTLRACI